jgi:hypothetical protein
MLLSELVDYALSASGEYITGNLSANNLNMEMIWRAIQPELVIFQRYTPMVRTFNISTNSYFRYDFSADPNNAGYSTDNPTTIAQSVSLVISSSQTFMLTLPNNPLTPSTIAVLFGDTQVATDDGDQNLVFVSGYSNYSGTVDYWNGTVTITVTDIVSDSTLAVTVNADYVDYGSPPVFLAEFTPIHLLGVFPIISMFISQNFHDLYNPNRLVNPITFLYQYLDGVVYYTSSGDFYVTAWYDYPVKEIYDESGNNLLDVQIDGIDNLDQLPTFQKMVMARLLIMLGRSRRAFTYTDLQVTTDAATLVQEGKEEYKEAFQMLIDTSPWYLSVRP